MAHVVEPFVGDLTTVAGTGDATVLATPPFGQRTFSAVLGVGDTFDYSIQHKAAYEFEEGIGTYLGADVFERTTVMRSSNGDAVVDFSVGDKTVAMVHPSYLAPVRMRLRLLADTTFHVATTGSDVTGTGSLASPWRTPQHAYNTLVESYDFGGFDVIIQFADGDYRNTTVGDFPAANGLSIRYPWTGGGFLTFRGNLSDRTAVKFGSTQANACALELDQVNIPSQLSFQSIQLILPEVTQFAVFSGNYVGQCVLSGCDFGGAASGGGAKVDISNFVAGLTLKIGGPMTFLSDGGFSNIAGCGAQLVFFAFGEIELGIGGVGVTSLDGPWMEMQAGGQVLMLGSNWSGQITGVGFNVQEGAIFQAPLGGPPPSTLPGTISPGGKVDFENFAANTWTDSFGRILDGKINYQVPADAFSINLSNSNWHTLLIPAASLLTGTLVFPDDPFDGQIMQVMSTQDIGTLTITPGSGDSLINPPTELAAGSSFEALYRQSNATWYFHIAGAGGSAMIFDTLANILALTPTEGAMAFASDQQQFLIGNGTAWEIDSSYTDVITAPDLGPYASNRIGYGRDYISDKVISNSAIGMGGSAGVIDGEIRYNRDTGNTGQFERYSTVTATWRPIVEGLVLTEDESADHAIQQTPIGFSQSIVVFNGDSVLLGLNGVPIIQGYKASIGAYPVPQHVDGGSF